ncbi:MAG: Gfo/Idh/MocA family oxidoreductase [Kordiimonadaceae bacterium]|nr:Gfo/Idh/MocA family oxidoreductase [Kordiimonadaceae bacterium]
MNNDKIKVAVIGAGSMGQNHIRIYSQLKDVELVGIYDLDVENGEKISQAYQCKFFENIQNIIDEVDAVSVCTPSTTHYEIASYFIKNGIHCLIEKPLATDEQDAKKLISLSNAHNVKILVGHVEQFNPAILQLKNILQNGSFKINNIKASRVGIGGARITDVGVVDDIMIHDLDIILSIVDEVPDTVSAAMVRNKTSQSEDLCVAMMTFPSGIIADITASRITHKRNRILEVDTDKGVFVLDYFTQELELYHHRKDVLEQDPLSELGTSVMDTRVEKILLRRAEPLTTELAHFISVIKEEVQPIVSGDQALKALKVAWIIKENLK